MNVTFAAVETAKTGSLAGPKASFPPMRARFQCCFERFVVFYPLKLRTPCSERFCHGCLDEVHYRLVCQCLRSQYMRSPCARTEFGRPWDPFGGYPRLSVPFPFPLAPFFNAAGARLGKRPGAVASEMAGRTAQAGILGSSSNDAIGDIESGLLSSSPQAAASRRAPR